MLLSLLLLSLCTGLPSVACPPEAGFTFTLQTLFERLVGEAEGGGACPLLWRAYLAYELGRSRPQVRCKDGVHGLCFANVAR